MAAEETKKRQASAAKTGKKSDLPEKTKQIDTDRERWDAFNKNADDFKSASQGQKQVSPAKVSAKTE